MLVLVLHMHSTLHTCKINDKPVLNISSIKQINGGMVQDIFSCLCLHHASHTVMQYSVSSCVAEFFLMVVTAL